MSNNRDSVYLLHIRDAIDLIEEFAKGMTEEDFVNNKLVQSAVIRQLEIIGEASRYISQETKNNYSNIPWRVIQGMRNVLIHEYFGVDLSAVWDVIENDLDNLKKQILEIINAEGFEK